MKAKLVAVSSICTAAITLTGTAAAFPASAEPAMVSGVNGLRQPCGTLSDDPRLTASAQRQADDMLANGVNGHIGSDGSSPQSRIADAGFTATTRTGEIVYWGTGPNATPSAALDAWMASPGHRAIILDCAYTVAGFATAWDGNKMTAVGDFAGS